MGSYFNEELFPLGVNSLGTYFHDELFSVRICVLPEQSQRLHAHKN